MELFELNKAPVNWDDFSTMKTLTCINHQGMRYLTKNPWERGIHVVDIDPNVEGLECDCPFADLRVIGEES